MYVTSIKELKGYTYNQLLTKLNCSKRDLDEFIEKIKIKNIISIDTRGYKFNYVGILNDSKICLYVFPKYMNDIDDISKFKQVIEVLKKYSKRKKKSYLENEFLGYECLDNNSSTLGNMISLIDDYIENGIYTKTYEDIELDGDGNIDWNYTIENSIAYNSNGNNIYLDLYTNCFDIDDNYDVTNIHKYALYKSIKYLKDTGLNTILNYNNLNINKDYYINKDLLYMEATLNRELSIQFEDRKLAVINNIKNIVLDKGNYKDGNRLSLYGTRKFDVVWENVCGYILDNEISDYIIDKANWIDRITKEENKSNGVLEPDILKKFKDEKIFFIVDAKYYNTKFKSNGKIKNTYPGMEDITKEYLYELALKYKYSELNNYKIYNIFMMPQENIHDINLFGSVELGYLSALNLSDIYLVKISAENAFSKYISNKRWDIFALIKLEIDKMNIE